MIYTIEIQLNGRTSPALCHYCQTAVTLHHGSHPGEPGIHRHYFKCQGCGKEAYMYPAFECSDCRQGSSVGGKIISYSVEG